VAGGDCRRFKLAYWADAANAVKDTSLNLFLVFMIAVPRAAQILPL